MHIEILVLSSDETLVSAVREAARPRFEVTTTADLEEASRMLAVSAIGVLLADMRSLGSDVPAVLGRLKIFEPALVTIIAGNRSDADSLLGLVNAGDIYRFLMRPVSPGQTRLFIEAAARHHQSLLADGTVESAEPEVERRVPIIPAAAAATVIGVALGGWWLLSGEADPESSVQMAAESRASSASKSQVAIPSPPPAGVAVADTAATQPDPQPSEDFNPDSTSAADRATTQSPDPHAGYVRVNEPGDNREPGVSEAMAEATSGDAETHNPEVPAQTPELTPEPDLTRSVAAAPAAIETETVDVEAASATPELFESRLSEERGRRLVVSASDAIAEGDLDEAATRLARAEEAGQSVTAEFAAARDALAQARAAQQRSTLLRLARTRTEQGWLVEPADDSALTYLNAAREAGADEASLAPILAELTSKLLATALVAISKERFDVAEAVLRSARDIGASENTLLAASQALAQGRDDVALRQALAENDRQLGLARARIDEGRLLEPAEDSAAFHLSELQRRAPSTEGLADARVALAGNLMDRVWSAIYENELDAGEELLGRAAGFGANAEDVALAQRQLDAAQERLELPARTTVAQVSAARTRYVPPEYPSGARRRGVEGWVELEYTVNEEGKVEDISIADAQPRNTFERAAINALRRWEYEASALSSSGGPARLNVRIQFSLQ